MLQFSQSPDVESLCSVTRWPVLVWLLMLAGGCASVELSRHTRDDTATEHYRYLHLSIELEDSAEAVRLADRFVHEIGRYDAQLVLAGRSGNNLALDNTGTARLKVEELERQIVEGEHHRTYGRRSLTQMRGRKHHTKPVITLRATLIDAASARTIFQADYVAQGPWHADSKALVAALPAALLDQLERDGLIMAR